jgi:hypothetical protein
MCRNELQTTEWAIQSELSATRRPPTLATEFSRVLVRAVSAQQAFWTNATTGGDDNPEGELRMIRVDTQVGE